MHQHSLLEGCHCISPWTNLLCIACERAPYRKTLSSFSVSYLWSPSFGHQPQSLNPSLQGWAPSCSRRIAALLDTWLLQDCPWGDDLPASPEQRGALQLRSPTQLGRAGSWPTAKAAAPRHSPSTFMGSKEESRPDLQKSQRQDFRIKDGTALAAPRAKSWD